MSIYCVVSYQTPVHILCIPYLRCLFTLGRGHWSWVTHDNDQYILPYIPKASGCFPLSETVRSYFLRQDSSLSISWFGSPPSGENHHKGLLTVPSINRNFQMEPYEYFKMQQSCRYMDEVIGRSRNISIQLDGVRCTARYQNGRYIFAVHTESFG